MEGNKSSSDTGVSELRTYVDSTFIEKANIADDLSTNSAVKVLSAKQGKTLDDKKFNVSGGTITGNVTINGTLTMGNSNSISVTKVPTANNDVANKNMLMTKLQIVVLGKPQQQILVGHIQRWEMD